MMETLKFIQQKMVKKIYKNINKNLIFKSKL